VGDLEAIRAALSLMPDKESRVLAERERATDFAVLGPLVMGGVKEASGGVDPAPDPWASWHRLGPLLKLGGISTNPPEYLLLMELLRCLVTRWGLEGAVEPPGAFSPLRLSLRGVTLKPPEEFDPLGLDSILRGTYGVNCFWSSAKGIDDSASTERGSLDACVAESLWGQIRSAGLAHRGGVVPAGGGLAHRGGVVPAGGEGVVPAGGGLAHRGGVVPAGGDAPVIRLSDKTPANSSKRCLLEARREVKRLAAQSDALTRELEDARSREAARADLEARNDALTHELAEERRHRADLAKFFRDYHNCTAARVLRTDMPAHVVQWIYASPLPDGRSP
jgi:hypothetical protein